MVNKALTAFGVIIAALVGLYLVLWALFDSAKTAAAVMVTIVLMSLGYVAGHIQWRNRDTTQQPPIYTAEATPVRQLPEPRWISTGDDSYTRSDALDSKAQRIGQLLRDRQLQPTRANIKAVGMECGVNGNEAASMIYRRFVEWQWAESVAQGQPGRWKEDE